jgi:hypothetical protein
LLFLLTTNLFAQVDTGTIVGQVTDPSGAVVAGATVVVTNTGTNVQYNTQTDAAGQYQVTALFPGTYSVRVTAAGFESAVRAGIIITVQARPAVDFKLALGQTTQTVEVTGASPVLQTQSADVGAVVQNEQVVDLPLNGRRYSDLAFLQAGIQRNPNLNNNTPDLFSANGNWASQNYFALDGIDNNAGSENYEEGSAQVVQPPPDAIEEFKMQTRTYSAEFGTSAGAVVNVSIKSGTNQIHGDLWEFNRVNALTANTYFNNAAGLPVGHYVQNQYGATIGGPIIKNRTFIFGDFQFFSSRQVLTNEQAIPTPLMLTGNFTELSTPLHDSTIPSQAGCVSGNIVSPGCIDPVAKALLAQFPLPNFGSSLGTQGQPGSWTGGTNYDFVWPIPDDYHSWDLRVDHTVSANDHLFARYSSMYTDSQTGSYLPPWCKNTAICDNMYAVEAFIPMYGIALAWDHTFGPTLLNELRGGFNRDNSYNSEPGVQFGLGKSVASQYGFTNVPNTNDSGGFPPMGINGILDGPILGIGVSQYHPQFQIAQVWQLVDNLSWLKGAHSIKFGYEYHKISDNFLDVRANQGQTFFLGNFTANGTFGVPDFELGAADTIYTTTPQVAHNYLYGHNFYAQDTWRVRPRLTINYGMRYELFSPVLNHQNQETNFNPAISGGGIIYPAPGASGWFARSLIHPDYHPIAPRVGFSYQPLSRVVLRGGYGVFFQHNEKIGSESMLALNPPWLVSENIAVPIGATAPVYFLRDGYPNVSSAINLPQLQMRAQAMNERTSYVEQTSFGPEIQIDPNTALDITYVGNWGRKMGRLQNLNQGMVTGVVGGVPQVSFPWSNFNTPTTHAYIEYNANAGNSNYDGLLVSLTRRFHQGFAYGVNYTWSHGLANFVDNLANGNEAVPENSYNYAAEYGNSIFDQTQRFVAYATYQLPFGPGKMLLKSNSVPVRVLAAGWQANIIETDVTGTAYEVNSADETNTGLGHNDPRPDCIGNPFSGANSNPRVGPLLNWNAFTLPAVGQYGNCGARTYHGPGFDNTDFSLFKGYSFTESKRLEFRAEFFNFLNHANFGLPSNTWEPFNQGSFGKVYSLLPYSNPREVQLALKFYF